MDRSEAIRDTGVETWVSLSKQVRLRPRKNYTSLNRSLSKTQLTAQIRRATYLHAALDNIKGANSHVGETTGEDASDHALAVVARVVNVTHSRGGIRFI